MIYNTCRIWYLEARLKRLRQNMTCIRGALGYLNKPCDPDRALLISPYYSLCFKEQSTKRDELVWRKERRERSL